MLKIFCSIGRFVVLSKYITYSRKYFVCLIFVAITAYKNILTMKICRFTVVLDQLHFGHPEILCHEDAKMLCGAELGVHA